MRLRELADTSRAVAGTRSRLKKRGCLSDCLSSAAGAEVPLIVNYLSGVLPQGRIGVGPSLINALLTDTRQTKQPNSEAGIEDRHDDEGYGDKPALELREVDATLSQVAGISGQGSKARRQALLGDLFARATVAECEFLARLMLGELRQGALEGVLIDAIAAAWDLPLEQVRRAVMLSADPAAVASAAYEEGIEGLKRFRLQPLQPVRPMLAQPAENIAAAVAAAGETALEYKLDGARVQIHKASDTVRIFSRALNEVGESLPEVAEAVAAMPADTLILDGEVIALHRDGRPLPFQVTMRRFGRKSDVSEMRQKLPLSAFIFDCLLIDGRALIDEPYSTRIAALERIVPESMRMPRLSTDSVEAATGFLLGALEAGHEGIMAKSPTSRYAAGSRGADWLKVKQAHTLDLVVHAAEWGSGRRKGWLSNLHLGAWDADHDQVVMLGKTFKGLTDKMLARQTEQLLELETHREGNVVYVRPELVVEIAVNDIQTSPQYPAGMALRFARVKRYRDDKTADQADTLETVRTLYAAGTDIS